MNRPSVMLKKTEEKVNKLVLIQGIDVDLDVEDQAVLKCRGGRHSRDSIMRVLVQSISTFVSHLTCRLAQYSALLISSSK